MVKSSVADKNDTQFKILEAICKAVDGNPHRLHGTPSNPGLFPGGKAGATLAQKALEEGLLDKVASPEAPTKGKSRARPSVYVRVTDRGKQFVQDGGSPVQVLSALQKSIQEQGSLLATSLDAGQMQLTAVRENIEQLQRDIQTRFAHYQQTARSLEAALQRLAPPAAASSPPPPPAAASSPPPPPTVPGAWLDEAVKLIAEQKRQNAFERLTLPRLFEQLKKTWPSLTLCQYHEGLRQLQEQRRIRLTAYTQALATLPDAQNALYLDREVKYYVDLP